MSTDQALSATTNRTQRWDDAADRESVAAAIAMVATAALALLGLLTGSEPVLYVAITLLLAGVLAIAAAVVSSVAAGRAFARDSRR